MTTDYTHPLETNGGVVTSWLPISTVGPTYLECSTAIYTETDHDVENPKAIAFDPLYGKQVVTTVSCLPPAATLWWQQRVEDLTVTRLGPFGCPPLYTTATTSVVNSMTTFVGCCPSDYTFIRTLDHGTVGQCNSPLTSGQTLTYFNLTASGRRTRKIDFMDGSVYGVHLNGFQFSTSSSPTVSSQSGLPTSREPSDSSRATPPDEARTSGLSSGAKAGIGVGVSLSVLGICSMIAAWYIIRRYREKAVIKDSEGTTTACGETYSQHLTPAIQHIPWEDTIIGPDYRHEVGQAQHDSIFEMSTEGRLEGGVKSASGK